MYYKGESTSIQYLYSIFTLYFKAFRIAEISPPDLHSTPHTWVP